MIYLANSFVVAMLDFDDINVSHQVQITRISGWEAGRILESGPYVSVYGHRDSAKLLARYWHRWIHVSREPIRLHADDILVVASTQRKRDQLHGYDCEHRPIFRFYLVRLVDSALSGEAPSNYRA